jgi:hypothetical protein
VPERLLSFHGNIIHPSIIEHFNMGRPSLKTYSHVQYESLIPPDAEGLDSDSEPEFPELRQAKRRRIEGLARQYLKGDTLFIASANLKGPFSHNPWRRNPAAAPSQDALPIKMEKEVPPLKDGEEMADSASDGEHVVQRPHGTNRSYRLIHARNKKHRNVLNAISDEGEQFPVVVAQSELSQHLIHFHFPYPSRLRSVLLRHCCQSCLTITFDKNCRYRRICQVGNP